MAVGFKWEAALASVTEAVATVEEVEQAAKAFTVAAEELTKVSVAIAITEAQRLQVFVV